MNQQETQVEAVTTNQAAQAAAESISPRSVNILVMVALAMVFAALLAPRTIIDLDIWHEMSLIREALRIGHLPTGDDPFAYTPTVEPVVHHEWGSGAIFYFVATRFGGGGILVLKYALSAVVAVLIVLAARRRGASPPVLLVTGPLAMLLGIIGFGTIRAGLFTLCFLALLLYFIELDRQGRRWWIVAWLICHVVWVNLHAGFVVGVGVLALYAIEQLLRRRPARHVLGVLAAMIALVVVNPYGLSYYGYVWRATTMPRPLIVEWLPMWRDPDAVMIGFYVLSLLLVLYAVWRLGWRNLPDLPIVLVTAYLAARHTRHLALYSLVWLAVVPAYLQRSQLGQVVDRLAMGRRFALWALALALAGISAVQTVRGRPWELRVPVNGALPGNRTVYPGGAVDYLAKHGFRGNVMTHFGSGAFVMWKLYPDVKVSLDSRYEVAYPRGAVEESQRFYGAKEGWQEILTRFPTDVVLIATSMPLHKAMPQAAGWRMVYQDDHFELYAREGVDLPYADARGEMLIATFP